MENTTECCFEIANHGVVPYKNRRVLKIIVVAVFLFYAAFRFWAWFIYLKRSAQTLNTAPGYLQLHEQTTDLDASVRNLTLASTVSGSDITFVVRMLDETLYHAAIQIGSEEGIHTKITKSSTS